MRRLLGIQRDARVNWGNENTFDFCFEGIEKGSVVAVSTYMASEHDNRKDQKEWFMAGYNEMLRRIEPEKIICYNTPFPEMEGDIVYVDYELSSWKYMNYERKVADEDIGAYKIGGDAPDSCDTMSAYMVSAGDGSAYGGDWKPSKDSDRRLVGNPGDINRDGDNETHIGPNGKADRERHNTDHGNSKYHSNPHDHRIYWDERGPHWDKGINYWDGNVPDFKSYRRCSMAYNVLTSHNSLEDNRFKTISDFKWCIDRGGEVEIEWHGVHYGIIRYGKDDKITIYIWNQPETEHCFNTADEALEYMVGNDRLRDVITRVTVIDRTI